MAELWVSLGCSLMGFLLIVYGVSLVSVPAAWMVAGGAVVLIGLWPVLRERWMGRG